ncbi:MAG TPA: hypothetical protein VF796_09660 [Humisphaera sp.]
MSASDAQKSEVHATTGDAASSPAADGGPDEKFRVPVPRPGQADAGGQKGSVERVSAGTRVLRDDTDAGGPLVVESDDPDLNPPRVPRDPMPTERTPEIDPPV